MRRLQLLTGGLLCALLGSVFVPLATAPAHAAATYQILITGDSITQGSSGDYTWRYRLWNKLAGTAPGEVAFVGTRTDVFDNVNNQYGAQYYAADFGAKAHSALWGDSYQNEIPNISSQVTSTGANVLVVMLGSNDLASGTSPADTINRVQAYIEHARAAKPGIDVVVGEVVNRYDPWAETYMFTAQVNEYATRLKTLAGQLNTAGQRVVIAPTRTGWNAKTMTWDGTHPNPTGEALIAQRVSQGLAQIGVGASSPDISGAKSWNVKGPTPSLTPGSEEIRLGWDREPSGATGMFIEQRLTNTGEAWQRLPYAVGGDGWTAASLAAGGTYQYRVVPSKGFNTGLAGGAAQARAGGPRPGAISDVRASAAGRSSNGAKARVTWGASINAKGYMLSYRLLHSGTLRWVNRRYPVTQRSWTFQPLKVGRRYQFRVRGVRGYYNGAWRVSGVARMAQMSGVPSARTSVGLGDSYASGLGAEWAQTTFACAREKDHGPTACTLPQPSAPNARRCLRRRAS